MPVRDRWNAAPGAKRIYTDATDKRILAKLDEPVPKGRARWNGKLVAKALGDVDINYVRRFLRKRHRVMDVVNEGQARGLVTHCGLDWDNACPTFHKNHKT
jgi:hypothetical protein